MTDERVRTGRSDPADLAAQHRVLVPEHQEFGILGRLTPGQHHQAVEQAAHEQIDDGEDHSAMIPTREDCPGQARSSNRALQAQAGTRTPEINLAHHRIRRKQVLGGLTHEYQIAA
jgi:hypothetical protein